MVAGQLGLLPGVRVGMETPHNRPRYWWGAGYGGRMEYEYHGVRKQQQKHEPRQESRSIWQPLQCKVGGAYAGGSRQI